MTFGWFNKLFKGKSKRTVTIHVTEEDIFKGEPGSARNCPVQIALTRSIGGQCTVGVTQMWSRIDRFTRVFKMNSDVSEFTKRFDHGLEVHPFSFDLEL